jgi:hypothetical protein
MNDIKLGPCPKCLDHIKPCRCTTAGVSGEVPGYKALTTADTIQVGDEWYNPDWEVAGPWYVVEFSNKMIGRPYESHFRRMRRAL